MEPESDRRAKMISALVEDMIRLAPLVPMRHSAEEDVRAWAQSLALLANFVYDAAEAAVDTELALSPDFTVPTARGHSN